MPGTTITHGLEYGQGSHQQQQSFQEYCIAAPMMYSVVQPAAQHSGYHAQHSSSWQPADMYTMTPDVASTYFGSEMGHSGGSSTRQLAHSSSRFANGYEQSNVMNYASSSISSASAEPQPKWSDDTSVTDDHQNGEDALENKWGEYQRQLGRIFQRIVDGDLQSACDTLLSITSWLLSQVVELGLNIDDTNLHAHRIQLRNDLNDAWLELGKQQIKLMNPNQQLSTSQSLLSKAMVKRTGNNLIQLCDGIEPHGLVDYQYGVREDLIIADLEYILDLYEAWEEYAESDNQ
ncbi:hypothetical protein FLAG1_07436 [Fusarium langsethiae]|uniref:Uncharacterized protein n=1 Tax=Fusarium langsethiae TaxID=179993 RepID=A0A0M9EU40_FUSLA|nr:hypothetical protein FLAG1_07436 [Fusarium langsethiae]GKU08131.1 unnamed protein product [Fusarium langsethiae]